MHGIPAPLWRILQIVSRSFGLSLGILPRSLRTSFALGYLLARAADTIADTRILPQTERLDALDRLRQAIDAPEDFSGLAPLVLAPQTQAERQLLLHLPECLHLLTTLPDQDRARVRSVVLTLISGMAEDLRRFPGEDAQHLTALDTLDDLDRYTYFAAGCVGEFWTEMTMAHRLTYARWDAGQMRRLGVRFGQALQMTNVLRDLAHDLRIGRCYLPLAMLGPVGLTPTDLLDPGTLGRLRPLLTALMELTLSHFDAAWAYTRAIPRREWRLRLACLWPLLIGLRTLAAIGRAENLLDPAVVIKISRSDVYAMMLESGVRLASNAALDRRVHAWRERARSAAGLS